MAKFLQPSFTGGELSPSLYARVDLARYGTSLRTARNFIVRPYGGVVNRPGTQFVGEIDDSAVRGRLVPFIYSTETAYVLELGDEIMRFWSNGGVVQNTATITGITQANPAVVTASGHGFIDGQTVTISGVVGMTQVNGNTYTVAGATATTFQLSGTNSSGFTAYGSAGSVVGGVMIATPWAEADLPDLRFTQSADVMWLVHPDYPVQKLSRTSSTSFTLEEFETKQGPFRSINVDEAVYMTSSAKTGATTVTCNASVFTADMVGSLVYLESKELTNIKPWTQGERGITVGALRRSDGKTYKAVTASTGGGATWIETGSFRPVHDVGRAWDGAGTSDTRTNGTQTWTVGVEWEYQDSGYGIVLITGYTNATTVTGIVVRQLPDTVVGGIGTASNTWNHTGDGTTKAFAVTGATSTSPLDYTVTIAGVPIEPNPYGTGGGACVVIDALVAGGRTAGDVRTDDTLVLFDTDAWEDCTGVVTYSQRKRAECVRIVTAAGAALSCSITAPIPTRDRGLILAPQLMGHAVAVMIDGRPRWDVVVDIAHIGEQDIQHITVGDRCFWAGDESGRYILHHNAKSTGV